MRFGETGIDRRVGITMLAGNNEPIYYCLVLSVYFLVPIVRLLGNTNGRPYLSVVTGKRHHATPVLNVAQVLLVGGVGGWRGCSMQGWRPN